MIQDNCQNSIYQLMYLTEKIVERIHECDENELIQFVEEREKWILLIRECSRTDQQNQLLREVLKNDPIIVDRMMSLKEQALAAMNKLGSGRVLKNGYQQSYTPDSILMDTKK